MLVQWKMKNDIGRNENLWTGSSEMISRVRTKIFFQKTLTTPHRAKNLVRTNFIRSTMFQLFSLEPNEGPV